MLAVHLLVTHIGVQEIHSLCLIKANTGGSTSFEVLLEGFQMANVLLESYR